MKRLKLPGWIIVGIAQFSTIGCPQRQEVSTTKGNVTIECDEAIMPVMHQQVDDFRRSYQEAYITLSAVGARAAIVDFLNDSVQIIATARPLNNEELGAVNTARIEYREYNIAFDAVAVIMHKENPTKQLRVSELDGILTGELTKWPGVKPQRGPIELALSGVNSSTNEIVRSSIMENKPFSPAASYFESSHDVVAFVSDNLNAIGIVNISWLKGFEDQVTVAGIGSAPIPPDSVARFYSPAQANIYRGLYPLSTKVFMYNREIQRTVGLGFIAYVSSVPGQKIFQQNGLVPATMPIRLVETTSKQVNQ